MLNLLFPVIEIKEPSTELISAYRGITQKKEAIVFLPLTLAFCGITIAFCLAAMGVTLTFLLYLLPVLLLCVFSIMALFLKPFTHYGAVIFMVAIENLLLSGGILLLSYPLTPGLMNFMIYILLISVGFIWVVIWYRKHYKNFVKYTLVRAAIAQNDKNIKHGGVLLGAIIAMFAARLLLNTFPVWLLGMTMVFLIGYYLNPVIAERLIVIRQHSQMQPYLQEYAGEENEPKV